MVDQELLTYLQSFLTDHRKEKFEEVLNLRTRHFTVVLEDIYLKHNTSAIVRSCDVFGIQDIHVIESKYRSYVSKHVSKGSEKWIDFHEYNTTEKNTYNCLRSLRSFGYQIIATTPDSNAWNLEDFDISKKSAFVFGVEKDGISDYIMTNADGFLKIPMVGFTESLNVSVAAAIILQSLSNRLRKSSIAWQLSDQEKDALRLKWTKRTIHSVDKIIERYYADKMV